MRLDPRSLARALLAVFIVAGLSGCAFMDEKNRRLLNACDEAVQPKSVAARYALAPAMIPAASMLFAADALIVQPGASIDDAASDIYELYWEPRDMSTFHQVFLVPALVVLTPPTFLGDWLVRSFFGFPGY